MTRKKRIALELLGPPVLGVVFLVGLAFVSQLFTASGVAGKSSWRELLFVVAYAYLFAGIPSMVFAAVMELAFSRGMKPSSWRSVALAALLGGAAGVAMGLFITGGEISGQALRAGGIFAYVGVAAGLTLGVVIKWRSTAR